MLKKTLILGAVLALCFPISALAHAVGEDYVIVKFLEGSVEGHFEIHFDDLQDKLGLELDADEEQAAQSVAATAAQVQDHIRQNYVIGPAGGTPYTLDFIGTDVIVLPQGTFGQYYFQIDSGPLPDALDISHDLFLEGDRLHRGLLLVEYNAKTDTTYPDEYTAMVFGPTNPEQTLDLNDVPGLVERKEMIVQGVWHIWIGIDHILFLVALMLTTVLVRRDDSWQPVEKFGSALWNLLKIVTVFTVAHSVTLMLAALDFISLPSRLVESVIALSIVLVALNNIFAKVKEGSLWIILGLGLFHGLGFASVMSHLPFRMVDLLWMVVNFNIGVELGQIAIVAVLFPILFFLRKSMIYEPVILKGVSVVLALIAAWWFIQRAFDLG